ncbi:hypothetical protein GCM10027515_05170 [Schumannella luteola]|uniref:AcrR family transcriptional regulator n=1 Tax=Schumannella luteola TaxID=472059 RepID=A0A852YF49_9MICO|nr:TetR/AcrR family transcriptional regulator [Schumannella luteola]NYG98347.1 AcrR family transcriptional regulator [Schumannella luteola]TPX05769.1 TetR/AcrR family transcriptional regulator [Schumannella luteola]
MTPQGSRAANQGRPRRGAISSSTVVEAGIAIAARDGLETLSMRTLATELGLSPMTLYRYVDSKDDLLDQMVLWVLARMEIPSSFDEDWRDRIVTIMTSWRDLLLAHAEIAPIMLDRPIPRGSVGLARLQEAVLGALEHGGLSGADAVRAFWQIFTVTVGNVMFDLPRRRLADPDMVGYATALRDIARQRGLHRVESSADELASIAGRGTFTDTLSTLLRGIASAPGGVHG